MQMDIMFLKACQNGQKGIVEVYLKKGGFNINYVDNNGFSALHYACQKGTRDIVRMLIANGADVTISNNRGITPLHLAAGTGNKEIIKMLVDNGADINATDSDGESVVIYGIRAGKTETVRYMKELGADITIADNDGRTAVDYASARGMTGVIENVLNDIELGADSYGNTPLHQACYNGHSETVSAILKNQGVNVDATNDAGETPMYIAVRESNLYVAELLVKAGADVNRRTDNGENLIHIATKQRKLHMVSMLVKNGADINVRNKSGETPLICAIKSTDSQKPSVDIVELLLAHKADVDCKDMWGKSALHYATNHNNSAIIEMLFEAGAEE